MVLPDSPRREHQKLHLGLSQVSPWVSLLVLIFILYNKTNPKSSIILSVTIPSSELLNMS